MRQRFAVSTSRRVCSKSCGPGPESSWPPPRSRHRSSDNRHSRIFAEAGAGLYEGLYAFRDDMPEVYRRLAYDLDLFWDSNDTKIKWLTRAYTVAAAALVVEILSLAALLGDNIF